MSEPFMLDLQRYLERLGYASAPAATLDNLRELQRRHTTEFAFETLSTMLRVPVEVEPAAIQDKLLHQGRGVTASNSIACSCCCCRRWASTRAA